VSFAAGSDASSVTGATATDVSTSLGCPRPEDREGSPDGRLYVTWPRIDVVQVMGWVRPLAAVLSGAIVTTLITVVAAPVARADDRLTNPTWTETQSCGHVDVALSNDDNTGPVPFSPDFSTVGPGWQGMTTVTGQVASDGVQGVHSAGSEAVVLKNLDTSDMTNEASIDLGSSAQAELWASADAGGQDALDFTVIPGAIYLSDKTGGSWTQLGIWSTASNVGTHDWKVVRSGGSYTVDRDGTQVVSTTVTGHDGSADTFGGVRFNAYSSAAASTRVKSLTLTAAGSAYAVAAAAGFDVFVDNALSGHETVEPNAAKHFVHDFGDFTGTHAVKVVPFAADGTTALTARAQTYTVGTCGTWTVGLALAVIAATDPVSWAMTGYYNEWQAAENGASWYLVAMYGAEGTIGLAATAVGAASATSLIRSAIARGAAEAELPSGYSSFKAAKTALGSPGEGNVFDHVVEQSQIARSGFAPEDIHNPFNMNPVSAETNKLKADYYSTKQLFTEGGTVRDWLTRQSFADQYEFGLDVLRHIKNGLPLP
jgi:hypothetical protein